MPLLGWIVVMFLAALVVALVRSAIGTARGVRRYYRAQRDITRKAVAAGHAPRAARAGEKAGAVVAATVSGPRLAAAAFRTHWKPGWRKGREWAQTRRDRPTQRGDTYEDLVGHRLAGLCSWTRNNGRRCRKTAAKGERYCDRHWKDYQKAFGGSPQEAGKCTWTVPDADGRNGYCGKPTDDDGLLCPEHAEVATGRRAVGETAPAEPPAPATTDPPEPAGENNRDRRCSYPTKSGLCVLRAADDRPFCRHHQYIYDNPDEFEPGPNGEPRARTDLPATKGPTTPMPIETRTNGEVLTQDQFKQELSATIAEAIAELEAAKADLDAMILDVARVEIMVASLASAEIDTATRAAVMALAGTNAASQAAHRARVSAAEQRIAAAQHALDTFNAARQTKFHANAS